MQLAIDQGNTFLKYALFEDNQMVTHGKMPVADASDTLRGIRKMYPLKRAVLSHTSEPDQTLLNELASLDVFIPFTADTPVPVKTEYKTPETLGSDRLAAAVGCKVLFPGENSLFIDMGTCITKNIINSDSVFLGGNISPGIQMRVDAMHQFTARLPRVELKIPANDVGESTDEALQNGAIRGAVDEIERFIIKKQTEFGKINVILTGGDVHFFENLSNIKIFAAPFLVLTGLNEILNYNGDKK
jgi:type III pantothenate kinase